MKRVLLAILLLGCQAAATPGNGCARSSDCADGLVCAIGRCRAGCRTSDDCGPGARCIVDPRTMVPACSLQVDSCATHDCALGFVCRDDQCLNACGTLVGCPDRVCEDGACVPVHGDAAIPVGDGGVSTVPHIIAGEHHFCQVSAAGALWCWGDATEGALGDGLTTHGDCDTCSAVPVQALDAQGHALANVTLAAGTVGTTCAVVAGVVECWGSGPLGVTGVFNSLTPVQVQVVTAGVFGPIVATTMLALGTDHACAVWGQNGVVSCWGQGPNGQLGNGMPTAQSDLAITATELAPRPIALSASQHHTVVIDASGAFHGVGVNSALELGSASPADAVHATSPMPPRGHLVTTNGAHTCLVGTDDDALHCVGGQLLDVFGPPPIAGLVPCDFGMCTATFSTSTVPNGEAVVALGMTLADACVATATGAVFCLGEGEIMAADSTTLVQMTSLHDVVELAGSADAMCALTSGGEVYCWGSNARGQLGRGTHDDGSFVVPALVPIPG